ncbi:MAG: zf-HC2 domain-containing protein, partial [Kitasatospora sp.]|nr:zf-HC2 domain-containing protein [Kitasatospora sp.]
MSGSGGQSPAEHHLGDRLAALVDGELCHETRDRVLAHLATCPRCKAEADAQRRLKDVFSAAAPPPPSDGFLARLQGLPGLDEEPPGRGPGGNPFGRGGRPRGRDDGIGLPPAGPGDAFDVLPAATAVELSDPRDGFRIHEIGRPGGSASRGRRFAFAAAGAVSFAAIALGGALPI